MKDGIRLAAFFLLVAGASLGCSIVSTPRSEPSTPSPSAAPTILSHAPARETPSATMAEPVTTPSPIPPPEPERAQVEEPFAALQDILRYVPLEWGDLHVRGFLGPQIYFLDFARMRADLRLPDLTGADNREAKIRFLTSLDTQGLQWTDKSMDPLSGGALAKWGWDVADVDQALYLPDLKASVLVGNFRRPEIEERLLAMGYKKGSYGAFALFLAGDEDLGFAVKPDTLLIAPYGQVLELLMARGTTFPAGVDRHPSVAEVLPHLGGAWGAVLAPSGDPKDLDAYFEDLLLASLAPKAKEFIKKYRLGAELEIAWDFMGIAFRPSGQETTIRFLYHYPDPAEAEEDIALAEWTLREAPFLASKWRAWGEVLSLQKVEARGALLWVETTTRSKSLLGDSLIYQYDLNFLPIRATRPSGGR